MTYFLMRIQEIPETGRDLSVSSKKEKWFENIIKDSISAEVEDFEGRLSAKISKYERTIEITGGVYLRLEIICDRCAEKFEYEQQIPFRILLEPAKNSDINLGDDAEDLNDDLDFSYYHGDEIDIGDLIRQHILMAQPISHICREDCKGLCPTCGKNLNEGSCKCKVASKESPFSVLKEYKPKQ